MKDCAFTPTADEAKEITEDMEYRHIKRVSEYCRMAVMQLVRRDKAAREKGQGKTEKEKAGIF